MNRTTDPGPLLRLRRVSLTLAALFAGVGVIFLILPGGVLRFFNELSLSFGLAASPTEGANFFLLLAVGYMFLVTLFAWNMYRMPENRTFPILLVNAKLASSLLSFLFFAAVSPALIYLVNGVVDGSLGAGVFFLYLRRAR